MEFMRMVSALDGTVRCWREGEPPRVFREAEGLRSLTNQMQLCGIRGDGHDVRCLAPP